MMRLTTGERILCLCLLAPAAGVGLTAFFFLMAALGSGGGHTFVSFIIIFPFAILPEAFGDGPPGEFYFLNGFIQYTAYYLIIVTARRPRQLLWRTAALFIAHWLAVIGCFKL